MFAWIRRLDWVCTGKPVFVACAAVWFAAAVVPTHAAALEPGKPLPSMGTVTQVQRAADGTLKTSPLDIVKANAGQVVVIDFWATWCPPCLQELPHLEKLYQRYQKRGLRVVAISLDRDEARMNEWVAKHKLSFPVVRDTDQTLAKRFAPPTMPTSFLVDRSGTLRFVQEGFSGGPEGESARELEARIKKLLAEKP